MNEHVKRAIDIVGGGAKLAAAIERSPQFVSQLLKGERNVPAELCPSIERATRAAVAAAGGEAVLCEDLRPDVDWAVVRENPIALAELATADAAQE
ncbi:hypothetical protein CDN99_06525 [Roseateles aquatilis]|uniref:Cro/Cl family transcriptional regulator n=1 Tax=Roseateles aquatilis TaxID=431061 RepID=A0A246JH71_9BURK|nr:YdaS family helix-turn-helix protein [Roseateles aquatilis]OWQ92008.1 hypothetical protein CDN99_06525 [Roseateles aquatilis]